MKIGIVGFGVVGQALGRAFAPSGHSLRVYDKLQPPYNTSTNRTLVNACDIVFVAVPTPGMPDGQCDLSQVEECVGWILPPICLKSTVPPGTVEQLSRTHSKLIAFSPEYIGEQPDHPWKEIWSAGFIIVGGPRSVQDLVISAFEGCTGTSLAGVSYHRTSARTAELCKYMENCFLATKVAFVNQFLQIALSLEVDFEELRRLWLLDSRVGQSHSRVTTTKGFGGRCLPKDLNALIATMRARGGAPLLEAVADYNSTVTSQVKAYAEHAIESKNERDKLSYTQSRFLRPA